MPVIRDQDKIIHHCGAVLLAAGASSRLGATKQLIDYNGRSFLRHVVATIENAGLRSVIVVLGANAASLVDEVDGEHTSIVINTEWREGIASSIRCGIKSLQSKYPACDGALILVCDQPHITVDLINQLIAAHKRSGKPIAASVYGGVIGTPVVFHQSFFPLLSLLKGDKGAAKILKEMPESVVTVDFPLGSFDIDTQQDYEAWQKNSLH